MSTTTPHPVDSTFYPCCHAIGQHGPDCTAEVVGTPAHDDGINATSTEGATMTTTTSATNVPLPAGTTWDGEWRQGARDCYGPVRTVEASGWLRDDVTVYTHTIQESTGEIRERIIVAPDLHPDYPLTSAQARQIGEALLAAADELDAIEAVAK